MTRGRHSLPKATKLLALVATMVVAAGIAVAAGSASAQAPHSSTHGVAAQQGTGTSTSASASADAAESRRSGAPAAPTAKGGFNAAPPQHGADGTHATEPSSEAPKPGAAAPPAVDPFPGRDQAGPPSPEDFVDIRQVPPSAGEAKPGAKASTGMFTSRCGTNRRGHRNSDNYMVAPGKLNGAQHVHDYVGNTSADAFSTNENLAQGGTTCLFGDKSVYFWPVLRDTSKVGPDAQADGGGKDGNVGAFIRPSDVQLQFRGNAASKVKAMPRFLMIITGDAKTVTNGPANARAQWTCSGFTDRVTTKYPLCPRGSKLMRILDFASCWDGQNLDSANHRTHMAFAGADGACPAGFVTVPQLRMVLSYERPNGKNFALDSFPNQRHAPQTDHGDFHNLMPRFLMALATSCINRGRTC